MTFKPGTRNCKINGGYLDPDPYTGQRIELHDIQIDHAIALRHAWDAGAWRWDERQRQIFANDPLELSPVSGAANREKSDSGLDEWLPSFEPCTYIQRYLTVAVKYQLPITVAERNAATTACLIAAPRGGMKYSVMARCAVLAIAAAAAAGCTTTVTGQPEPGDAARQAADLNALLLTPDEVDSAMNATGMTVDATTSTLVDDSPYTKPAECLAVSSIGQEHVYAGSYWSVVRMQSLHESGEDYSHLAHQAVVGFPTAADAAAFYTKSISLWGTCAPASYTYGAGQQDITWHVGQVDDNAGMLIASTSQQGAGWLCLRALTTAAAIVVDILTCSDDPTGALAAQRIAREIASRVAGQ